MLSSAPSLSSTPRRVSPLALDDVSGSVVSVLMPAHKTVPDSPEGKEQFFMEQVALGEQLAARCEFYTFFPHRFGIPTR